MTGSQLYAQNIKCMSVTLANIIRIPFNTASYLSSPPKASANLISKIHFISPEENEVVAGKNTRRKIEKYTQRSSIRSMEAL